MLSYSLYKQNHLEYYYFNALNDNQIWYFNPAFISSLVALVIALGFIEKIKNWIFRPKLIIAGYLLTPQNSIFHGRIKIVNSGKSVAKGVKVEVEQIEDDVKIRKDYIPCPLGWTHIQTEQDHPAERNIYPNQPVFLNIFTFYPQKVQNITLSLVAGRGITNFENINKGITTLRLRLYQEDGQSSIIIVKLNWDGKNKPKINYKMP